VTIVEDEWFVVFKTVVQIFHLQRGNRTCGIYTSLQTARLNIFLGGVGGWGQFLTNRVKVIA
jgi:hypothetical protein